MSFPSARLAAAGASANELTALLANYTNMLTTSGQTSVDQNLAKVSDGDLRRMLAAYRQGTPFAGLPFMGGFPQLTGSLADDVYAVSKGTGVSLLAGEPWPASSFDVYGHSWPAGFGTTTNKYRWSSRLAKLLHCTENNQSLSGAYIIGSNVQGGVAALLQAAAFATDLTAGPYVTWGGLKAIAMGYNDWNALVQGTVANSAALVESCLTLACSRLLAARTVNALSNGTTLNAGLTYNGTWNVLADTTISMGPGLAYTTVAGSYVELALDAAYNGEAITAVLPMGGAAGAVCTFSVGGVTKGTPVNTAALQTAQTATGLAQGGTVCARLPAGVLAAGAQTLRLTFTSFASTGPSFSGFIIEGNAPAPLMMIGAASHPGVPLSTPTGFSAGAAWQTARYQAVLPSFPSAFFVDANPALAPNYGTALENNDLIYWFDAGHPNNLGHGRMAAQILAAYRALSLPGFSGQMS